MGRRRVFVGMSGGVDSAMSAWLLKQQGFEVVGVHLLLTDDEPSPAFLRLCETLGVASRVLPGRDIFRRMVLTPFLAAYAGGMTPNPCALCNPGVKFALLAGLIETDDDRLATGHYVRLRRRPDGIRLLPGVDSTKDQSYFLALTPPALLERAVFPLGELTKPEVTAMARREGLPSQSGESQDACFLAGENLAAYLERRLPALHDSPGVFLDRNGDVVGRHAGAIRYTIGQSRGLGLGGQAVRQHVLAIDAAANSVTVGPRDALLRRTAEAERLVRHAADLASGRRVRVKTRYRQHPVSGSIIRCEADFLAVRTDDDLWAVTPGQVLAVYDADGEGELLAGGIITASGPATGPVSAAGASQGDC